MRYIATVNVNQCSDGTMEGTETLEQVRIELGEWDNFDPDYRVEDIHMAGLVRKYADTPDVTFFVTYEKVEPLGFAARTFTYTEDRDTLTYK